MAKVLKHIYLRKDQEKELKRRKTKGLSKAQIVRNALDYYFKNKDQ